MSVLSDLREELAGLMTAAGIVSTDFIPEVVNPPVAIVSAADPFIQEVFDTKTFNHDYRVRMEVRLVASPINNEAVTDELDDLICKALMALQGSWECDVSQPFQYEVNGSLYLAADISISTSITIA